MKRLFISELQNGLTQKEIAERVGTSQPHVSSWLSGQRIPSSKNLMKLIKGDNTLSIQSGWRSELFKL